MAEMNESILMSLYRDFPQCALNDPTIIKHERKLAYLNAQMSTYWLALQTPRRSDFESQSINLQA